MSDEMAKAVGSIPSGLFIVCAREEEVIDGYLASWVQQVSFDPLMLSLSIKPGRPAYDLISQGKPFSINIVGKHEMTYLKHFWSGYDPENNPFHQINYDVSQEGTVWLKDAKAVLDCKMTEKTKPGDHEVFFAQVTGGKVLNDESEVKVHLRKSGLDY